MPQPSHSKTTLICLIISTLIHLSNATCYWANSTLAPNDKYSIAKDDTACFPNQANSPCCGTGWSCLSDGVCYIKQGNNEFYYRGTCTDKTWGSQQCPGFCFAQNNSTSVPIAKCKKSTGEDWYCCPGDPDCNCNTGVNAVKLGAAQPTTVTVIGSTSWPGYQSTSTASGSTATSKVSSTATGTANSATTASAGALSATTSPSAASTDTPKSSNTALAAGLGAGIGGAVLLLGAGGFFLFQRRKRRAADELSTQLPSSASTPYHGVNSLPTTPHPTKGYYAANPINEKDGQKILPQELPAYQQRSGVVEMDGTAKARGAVELA